MISLPSELEPVIGHLIKHHCSPVLVGGYVRDALLGIESKDIDIEVYSVKNLETLQELLSPFGNVNAVGKSFGVLKLALEGFDIDFSLPRTESKKGAGHRGFDIRLSSRMDFTSAAKRRDFTVNAMGFDLNSSILLDPYGGQKDLEDRLLRCVNPDTFVEDPLRILRALQMAARFKLRCDEALIELCASMTGKGMLDELPKERIFEEFRKLLLKADNPSIGFELMKEMGVVRLFPELEALIHIPQDPEKHPEGDVWTHTLLSLDAMAKQRTGNGKRDLTLMLAVLCHDFGKPFTTEKIDGQWRALGHSQAGEEPTRWFLERICDEKKLIDDVVALVLHHQKPLQFYTQGAKSGAIRRLALKVSLEDVALVGKADYLGRTTEEAKTGNYPAGEWLLEEARKLDINGSTLKPLLQGRDLIAAGLEPSERFKTLLETAYDAQLDGEFDTLEGAKTWLKHYLKGVGKVS